MLFNGKLPIIKGLLVIVDKLYMDDYRGLFPDTEVLKDIPQYFFGGDFADYCADVIERLT